MKQLPISNATYNALQAYASKNFRTVELQLEYWMAQDAAQTQSSPKAKVDGRGGKWSEAKRRAQSERLKAMWAEGKLGKRRRKYASAMDTASTAGFDD
jgi:hypothetical protein